MVTADECAGIRVIEEAIKQSGHQSLLRLSCPKRRVCDHPSRLPKPTKQKEVLADDGRSEVRDQYLEAWDNVPLFTYLAKEVEVLLQFYGGVGWAGSLGNPTGKLFKITPEILALQTCLGDIQTALQSRMQRTGLTFRHPSSRHVFAAFRALHWRQRVTAPAQLNTAVFERDLAMSATCAAGLVVLVGARLADFKCSSIPLGERKPRRWPIAGLAWFRGPKVRRTRIADRPGRRQQSHLPSLSVASDAGLRREAVDAYR